MPSCLGERDLSKLKKSISVDSESKEYNCVHNPTEIRALLRIKQVTVHVLFILWISVYEPLCRGKGAGKQSTTSFVCKRKTRHSVVRAQVPLKMCLDNGNL